MNKVSTTETIYGLKCPLIEQIKWVGRTTDIKERYKAHLYNFGHKNQIE